MKRCPKMMAKRDVRIESYVLCVEGNKSKAEQISGSLERFLQEDEIDRIPNGVNVLRKDIDNISDE